MGIGYLRNLESGKKAVQEQNIMILGPGSMVGEDGVLSGDGEKVDR